MNESLSFLCVACNAENLLGRFSGSSTGNCKDCNQVYEAFPVVPGRPDVTVIPKSKGESDASCYNHANNKAEGGCDLCGRLICSVCQFEQEGKKICAICFSSPPVNRREERLMRYDWAAEYTAYGTIVTAGLLAPLTIYFIVLYYTNQKLAVYETDKTMPRAIALLILALLLDGAGVMVYLAMRS